jgi:hypothetical protein
MSATAEGRSPLWRPEASDLAMWYSTFEVFAASAPPGSQYFHGPHVAAPVDLRRVEEGLRWLETQYQADPAAATLPTLERMRAELLSRRRLPSDLRALDSGSPMHNFWHWLHGN